jgi:hypothetical protein
MDPCGRQSLNSTDVLSQAFERHVQNVYNSEAFKAKASEAQPFFKGVRDFVFGRPATLENIVSFIFLTMYFQSHSESVPVECTSGSLSNQWTELIRCIDL